MSALPAGEQKTVGVLGGGQLGRMLAIEAHRLGYRVLTLDPGQGGPTAQVAAGEHNAPYHDQAAAIAFAEACDVVTFEFENVPSETLDAIAATTPVHPSPTVLGICRHRQLEKAFLKDNGFPIGEVLPASTADEVTAACQQLGRPCILKTATFGYDGKGQVRLEEGDDERQAWAALGSPPAVVEALVPFARELSVVVARNAGGDIATYPVFENEHARHILDVTTCPARISAEDADHARALAAGIAKAIDLVGVLCVELFQLEGGELLVNELAPRPHNSGHLTLDACATSQFEQQLRAIAGLPLGDTSLHKPAVMVNLLGNL
jgi:5-(carboxyamino)imidazole ribonucleotide synthase